MSAEPYAIRLVREALEHDPQRCRYHGSDFERSDLFYGEPRCDSCKQPWRVTRALAALDNTDWSSVGAS